MENMIGLFVGLDPKIVLIAAGLVAIAGFIALFKKAIKIGIFVLAIALLVTVGGTYLGELQQQYGFSADGSVISMKLDGKDYTVDIENIDSIKSYDNGNGSVKLEVWSGEYKLEIDVPRFIYNAAKGVAKQNGLEITEVY